VIGHLAAVAVLPEMTFAHSAVEERWRWVEKRFDGVQPDVKL
jgi:hypothetical protein